MLRVWSVGVRAMHLDESTVAWFAWQLVTGHGYAYDPVYHGPFQHEMLALIFVLFQASQTSARMLAVLLGTGLVILPWFLRDYLGRLGALASSFLIAISPSFIYFGRFERDDTYMEFFTFLMVVLALRFIRDRKAWQLYGFGIAFALAFTTKESIYIVAFIFGSFLALDFFGGQLRRWNPFWRQRVFTSSWLSPPVVATLAIALVAGLALTLLTGLYAPVPTVAAATMAFAVLGSSGNFQSAQYDRLGPIIRRHWISAATIGLGIIVLMYSTFGTNLNGLWDHSHPFLNANHSCPYSLALNLNACRKDIVGGLFYWLSQDKVKRGGQPWYYYLLIYGLYEQLVVLFGAVAVARTFVIRTMPARVRALRVFLMYWSVLTIAIYSWAGEKFPWLGIHPLLPLTLLAGIEIVDLSLNRRRIVRAVVLPVAGIFLILTLHNSYVLNYVNGANPVEMMVYVQSSPHTAADANRIGVLSNRATNGTTLRVTIDATDTWPFAWYLRNMPNVVYPSGSQAVKRPYVRNPIVILDQTDAATYGVPASLQEAYTHTRHRLDWWFPEKYKTWTWSNFGQKAINPRSWQAIWNWEIWRTPFGRRNGTWYYLYVKKGYFAPF